MIIRIESLKLTSCVFNGNPLGSGDRASPGRGYATGGDPIVIFGSNFSGGVRITIGWSSLTQMSVLDTLITASRRQVQKGSTTSGLQCLVLPKMAGVAFFLTWPQMYSRI